MLRWRRITPLSLRNISVSRSSYSTKYLFYFRVWILLIFSPFNRHCKLWVFLMVFIQNQVDFVTGVPFIVKIPNLKGETVLEIGLHLQFCRILLCIILIIEVFLCTSNQKTTLEQRGLHIKSIDLSWKYNTCTFMIVYSFLENYIS